MLSLTVLASRGKGYFRGLTIAAEHPASTVERERVLEEIDMLLVVTTNCRGTLLQAGGREAECIRTYTCFW